MQSKNRQIKLVCEPPSTEVIIEHLFERHRELWKVVLPNGFPNTHVFVQYTTKVCANYKSAVILVYVAWS